MAKIDFKNVQTMIGNGAVVNGPISLKGGIIIYGKVYGDIPVSYTHLTLPTILRV